MNHTKLVFFFVALTLACAAAPARADAAAGPRSGALFDELARMDRALFEVAFVSCDAEALPTFFTEDVEFYHDLVPPTFGEEVRTLKSCPADHGVRRVLVPESVEVYPMKDYGAIQMGEHWFIEQGAETSTLAKFVHLWLRDRDGGWRIARVLSFDHQSHPRSEAPE